MANSYRLPTNEGSLIAEVQRDGPAYIPDLRKGDIIESVDGIKITDPYQISHHIRKRNINDRIIIKINRYGKKMDKEIQLMPYPTNLN